MDGLSYFFSFFASSDKHYKALILFDQADDLDRALDSINTTWQIFEIIKHNLYKIAEGPDEKIEESTQVHTRKFEERFDASEYRAIIVVNPALNRHFHIINAIPNKDPRSFYVIYEPIKIAQLIDSGRCRAGDLSQMMKWVVANLVEKPAKRRKIWTCDEEDEDEEEEDDEEDEDDEEEDSDEYTRLKSSKTV